MKICHVIEASGGGSGRTSLFLISLLIKQGHDVTLIYSPLRADASFLAFMHSIQGLKVIPLAMERAVGLHDAVSAFRLYILLRRWGPFDIVHSHSSKAGGLARLAGLLLPGTRQIYTPHAFVTMDPFARKIYGVLEWILGWLCSAIIVVSQAEGDHATRYLRIPARKIHVVPNGAKQDHPADRDAALRILNRAKNAFIIALVGRLAPQKRPERAVEAFKRVADKYPETHLAIIGDGALEAETKNLVAVEGLQNRVGFYAGYDARNLMPGIDALLCSSDYEGFANVFLEALAEGVPIVTTPVGGAQEAIIEGKTGFATRDFSAASLAQRLEHLLGMRSEERAVMAVEARAHILNFTIEKMYENTLNVYRHVLASPEEKEKRP